ncbi:hypothetical protein F2Q69_00041673 [Brassica cretica]|uniref:Uncharacterized protein n=1 Tax=Brassica cretica TaxID=69181 RepID=A0A8S9N871_BRACR|nr:hypothetical protein F2Q69_00041673 [Brassica cretica]
MTSGDDGGREDGGSEETISSSDGGNDRLEVEKAATAYVFAASDSHVSEAH